MLVTEEIACSNKFTWLFQTKKRLDQFGQAFLRFNKYMLESKQPRIKSTLQYSSICAL